MNQLRKIGSEVASEPNRQEAAFVNVPLRQRLKEALLRRILGGHYDPGERLDRLFESLVL